MWIVFKTSVNSGHKVMLMKTNTKNTVLLSHSGHLPLVDPYGPALM